MDFNTFKICYMIIILVAIIVIATVAMLIIRDYLKEKNRISLLKVKNEQYDIFMRMNPDEILSTIDSFIETYVTRYIVYKFVSKKVTYIKHEEVTNMVNDITKLIAVEISELYVFYIKMIREISTEEDLISFIHTRVQNACIEHVSTFNKSLEPSKN